MSYHPFGWFVALVCAGVVFAADADIAAPESAGLPVLELSADAWRQSFVAQGTATTYEGHPTTLLPDGTIVYAFARREGHAHEDRMGGADPCRGAEARVACDWF